MHIFSRECHRILRWFDNKHSCPMGYRCHNVFVSLCACADRSQKIRMAYSDRSGMFGITEHNNERQY
jgi:hypothetical protein